MPSLKEIFLHPVCSKQKGELNERELQEAKEKISQQDKLLEAVNRLTYIVSKLPVSYQTANIIIQLLLKLDKKLTNGGVDDSDGTVGAFIQDVAEVLKKYAKEDEAG